MGIINDDDELLAKLRSETSTAMDQFNRAKAKLNPGGGDVAIQQRYVSDVPDAEMPDFANDVVANAARTSPGLELPAIDLSASQAPLGGQQVSPGFGVLEAQQGLPSAAAEAPVPAIADIIKQGIAQQAAQKKPSRLEQLASAIRGGGEAVGEGLGKVGAGIGKVLGGGGAPAESDGYDRAGHAFYAAMTGQKLPQSFFQRGKPEDKEMVALDKELRRAQILKALRGEPVKPVDPADDFKSPISLAAQDVQVDRLRDLKLSPEQFARAEKLIRMQSANQLKGSTPLGTQVIGDYYRGRSADARDQNINITMDREDRNERKFAYQKLSDFDADVQAFNNKYDKANVEYQREAAREADRLLGGALSAGADVPLPSTVDAFDLPHKVDERLKFLPSRALKKLQGEYEAEKARNPNAKTADITKKLMSNPEYAASIEQLQISTKVIDNILTNKLYGTALSEQEAARARAMLGTEWGQTPAGRVYALRLVTRAMDKALKRQSGVIKGRAERSGMLDDYNDYVNNGYIIEGVWDTKPQPAAQEEKPRVSPLDRPSNPSDKGPQVPVPEGMPEVTTQVSEPTPAQLDELASGNKKQIIRVKPKAPAAKAALPQEGEEFTVKGLPGTYKMVNGKPERQPDKVQ